MKLTNTQIECMIEDLSSEIIRILMEEWQYNMTQAMEVYYNSDTFERLSEIVFACKYIPFKIGSKGKVFGELL